jgi:hypothetical protein
MQRMVKMGITTEDEMGSMQMVKMGIITEDEMGSMQMVNTLIAYAFKKCYGSMACG